MAISKSTAGTRKEFEKDGKTEETHVRQTGGRMENNIILQ